MGLRDRGMISAINNSYFKSKGLPAPAPVLPTGQTSAGYGAGGALNVTGYGAGHLGFQSQAAAQTPPPTQPNPWGFNPSDNTSPQDAMRNFSQFGSTFGSSTPGAPGSGGGPSAGGAMANPFNSSSPSAFAQSLAGKVGSYVDREAVSGGTAQALLDQQNEALAREQNETGRATRERLSSRGLLGSGVEVAEERKLAGDIGQRRQDAIRNIMLAREAANYRGTGEALGIGNQFLTGQQGSMIDLLRQQLEQNKFDVRNQVTLLGSGGAGGTTPGIGGGGTPPGSAPAQAPGTLTLGSSGIFPGSVGSFNTSPENPENAAAILKKRMLALELQRQQAAGP